MSTAPPRRLARLAPLSALVATVSAALSGCSAIGMLNTLQPGGGVTADTDIAYTQGERGALDVYRPAPSAAPAPVVVFFYGGGWDSGSRADYRFVGRALARRGFLTVIPDYRIYPAVRFPAFLEDSAMAVRWAHDNAARFGGDPNRLFLMGHSAGAYNAVEMATDRRWLRAVNLDPTRDIKGVVGLAGPYDFLPLHSDELRDIFGPEPGRPATQPINYVDGKEPAFFLAVDTGDKVVSPGNTTRFAAKVRSAGGSVEVKEYKGLNHALVVAAIAAPLRFLAPVLADVTAFLRAKAGAPA